MPRLIGSSVTVDESNCMNLNVGVINNQGKLSQYLRIVNVILIAGRTYIERNSVSDSGVSVNRQKKNFYYFIIIY